MSKKHLTRDLSAIYSGPTPMIDAVGVFHLVVPATVSVKTFLSNSTTQTILRVSLAPISSSWMATTGHMRETSWQSSQLPITATDVVMRPQLWRLTNLWSIICKLTLPLTLLIILTFANLAYFSSSIASSSIPLLARPRFLTSASAHPTTSSEKTTMQWPMNAKISVTWCRHVCLKRVLPL